MQVLVAETGFAGFRKHLHGIAVKAGIEPKTGEELNEKRRSCPSRAADNDVAPFHRPTGSFLSSCSSCWSGLHEMMGEYCDMFGPNAT
jgi:hypothetical protein